VNRRNQGGLAVLPAGAAFLAVVVACASAPRPIRQALSYPVSQEEPSPVKDGEGTVDRIMVECEFAKGHLDSENHEQSCAMYEGSGRQFGCVLRPNPKSEIGDFGLTGWGPVGLGPPGQQPCPR